jgi:hypothetical protein
MESPLKVFSIDIGIINLGYVYSEMYFTVKTNVSKMKNLYLHKNYYSNKESAKKNIHIIDCNKIDITKIKHNTVSWECCTLHHESCIPDYLDHFIQEHQRYFDECDVLILERQPPVGITNVQDLLFTKFRDKVVLISPNTVHKYFSLNTEYTVRKIESERIATEYLNDFKKWEHSTRKHDMSDALLMILYYYKTKMDSLINETISEKNNCDSFEQFRYTN